MSLSAAHAAAFATEATEAGSVWAIRDDGGYPAPMNAEGNRAMPFWSKRSRIDKIIETVPAYRAFQPVEIGLEEFLDKWVPDLAKDGLSIGLNWYGKRVTGYHLSAENVLAKFGRTGVAPSIREVDDPALPSSRLAKFLGWLKSRA